MRLVVLLPTFNESENIEEIIKRVLVSGRKLKNTDLHVLISDSHSPDGTAEIVKKISKNNPRVHYLDVKVRGLGVGVVKGHRYAIDRLRADVLAQMDADLSHDPSTLPHMISLITSGYSLINGSRMIKGGKNLLGWHRRMFTRGSAFYCKVMWGVPNLTEFTNSYRVFTKELFEKIDFSKVPWKAKTYIIQPSFLYAAIKAGAKIKEVPITFEDRKKGYSKAQIVSYILDVIKFGLKVRLEKSKTLIKFLMVGSGGYLVNSFVLGLLNRGSIYSIKIFSNPLLSFVPAQTGLKLNFFSIDRLFVASVISIETSIIFNFLFHENWTFKDRSRSGPALLRFFKFNLSSIGSPIVQLASILFFVKILNMHEQIGLAIGVVFGIIINYTINLIWIWKSKTS